MGFIPARAGEAAACSLDSRRCIEACYAVQMVMAKITASHKARQAISSAAIAMRRMRAAVIGSWFIPARAGEAMFPSFG